MIDKALTFIANFLNHELRFKHGLEDDLVVVSSLINPDGSVAQETENKIVISVINLEHETAIKSVQNLTVSGNKFGKKARPVYLNLYVMVSANYNSSGYEQALKMLSSVIGVFQANTYFTKQMHPEMLDPVDQLNLEIVNLPLNDLSHIWSGIGAKYVPSMLYKIRMIGIQEDKIQGEVPAITGHSNDNVKKK